MRRSLQPAVWLAILTVGLGLVLAACSSGTTPDTTPPSLSITSNTTSSGASYHLTGKASDNIGATKITYTVNGGATKTVNLSSANFDVTITLTSGANTIDVTVYDAAGNKTAKTITVTYKPSDSLGITVNAPSGVTADITVTGPGSFSRHISAGTTLTGLADGTYTIAAASVTSSSKVYDPGKASQTVTLTSGQTGSATVTYTLATSADLQIDITGLPANTAGSVDVSGPGVSKTITASTTLTGLAAGTYSVTPANVTDGTYDYQGTASKASVSVSPGNAYVETVTYTPIDGVLQLASSGVPSGMTATIDVASATSGVSYSNSWSASSGSSATSFGHLAPADYTVSASSLTQSGTNDVYAATVTGSPATVAAGKTANASVAFHRTTNHLTVDVTNLPTGATATMTVTAAGGFSQTAPGGSTLTGLADNTYAVTAPTVSYGGHTYAPTPATRSQQASLSGGQDATVTVDYALQTPTTGSLQITITTPPGVTANVSVSNGNGYSATVNATTNLSGLVPGAYTITPNVVTDGTYHYKGTATATTVTVNAGGTASVTVTYAASDGALSVPITGLPSGTLPSVSVTGTGYTSPTLTGSTTLTGLTAGTYALTPSDVTDGTYTFHGTEQSHLVAVSNGATANDPVNYAAIDGALSVTVKGLPTGTLAGVSLTEQGGAGKTYTINASTTIVHMAPGTYAFNIPLVRATDQELYGDTADAGATVTIVAGATAATTLTFTVASGDLQYQVFGVTAGNVTLTSSDPTHPVTMTLTTTQTVKGLYASPSGTVYTLTSHNVTDGLYDYVGSPPITFTLQPGYAVGTGPNYTPIDGAISITFSGTIPAGSSYGATITYGSVTKHVSTASAGTAVIAPYLPAGIGYTVTPDAMPPGTCSNHQRTVYVGTVSPTSTPSVTIGQTTQLTIQYTAVQGPC
jgi:hypothetical protein